MKTLKASKTNYSNLSDAQISALRNEAMNAGDYMMAFLCDLSAGDRSYRRSGRFLSREEREQLDYITPANARGMVADAIASAEAQR
jgi:hypothetical protein